MLGIEEVVGLEPCFPRAGMKLGKQDQLVNRGLGKCHLSDG